jgi:4a-hydroxytetrahydrobiopterin dehydratase
MSDLVQRTCQACNKDTPRLGPKEAERLHDEVPDWRLGEHLQRRYTFKDFVTSIRFVDEMAKVAESEGHHPIFKVDYDKVDVDVWTHAIDALSENDFILAAKLDRAARTLT